MYFIMKHFPFLHCFQTALHGK